MPGKIPGSYGRRKAKPNNVKNPYNPQDPDWMGGMRKRKSSKRNTEQYQFRPKKYR